MPANDEEAPPTVVRPARRADAPAVADLWLRSRRASEPAIPAPIHTDDEVRAWFASIVLPAGETWVAETVDTPESLDITESLDTPDSLDAPETVETVETPEPRRPVGVLVLDGPWLDQLYVEPTWFGRGVGSALVSHARSERPDGLDLWTFQANRGARRFYERHGFVAIAETDGDNEEGAPDVRYRWQPA